MEWKLTLFLLCAICNNISILFDKSDASPRSRKPSALKTWFKLLSGWTSSASINRNDPPLFIESSFPTGEQLKLASRAFNLRQFSYNSGSSYYCIVTYTSIQSNCGRACTHTTEHSAYFSTLSDVGLYSTTTTTLTTSYSPSCNQVTAGCIATAVAAAAVVVAIGVAVPLGFAAATEDAAVLNVPIQISPEDDIQVLVGGGLFDNQTPVNDLAIPVQGNSLPNDGCGDSSIRFQDGRCYPVLKRGPCRNPHYWVTVDPVRLMGQCAPRLCGRDKVFVGADGLCHDSEDPLICRGGRKLFYTAYGDPICDCPIGQYPFPTVQDDCVTLFTRGPCPIGQVVTLKGIGNIRCAPSKCQFNANLPLALYKDGFCYALGSQGPCRGQPFQLFGYDVFLRQSLCVNVSSFNSPYFISEQEANSIDELYKPKADNDRIFLVTNPQKPVGKRGMNATFIRRQESMTSGLFQLPARLPTSLLNPCRPGARNGNNYKCTNPLVYDSNGELRGRQLSILQAVRSVFECPDATVLQATGKCGNDAKGASCGPSYRYIEAIGQCRALF